jgi:hypothetical protein
MATPPRNVVQGVIDAYDHMVPGYHRIGSVARPRKFLRASMKRIRAELLMLNRRTGGWATRPRETPIPWEMAGHGANAPLFRLTTDLFAAGDQECIPSNPQMPPAGVPEPEASAKARLLLALGDRPGNTAVRAHTTLSVSAMWVDNLVTPYVCCTLLAGWSVPSSEPIQQRLGHC